jgi:predicted enzyme related to lactoylglutathione lyase
LSEGIPLDDNARATIYWIDHYTVCTNDLERFKTFHAEVLGGEQYLGPTGTAVFQTVAHATTGGFALDRPLPPSLGLGKGFPRYGFFVEAEHIDQHLARLKRAGAKYLEPRRTSEYGASGTVVAWEDPDGNQFEFWAPDVMPEGAMADCGPERVGRLSHGVFESRDLERNATLFDRYFNIEHLDGPAIAPDTLVYRLAAGARLIFCKVETLAGRTMGFGMPDPHTALLVRSDEFLPTYLRLWAELPDWDYEFWTAQAKVPQPETLAPRMLLHASPAGRRFKTLTNLNDGFLDWDTNFFHLVAGSPIDGSMAAYEKFTTDVYSDQIERGELSLPARAGSYNP